jgi:hypothetical protein
MNYTVEDLVKKIDDMEKKLNNHRYLLIEVSNFFNNYVLNNLLNNKEMVEQNVSSRYQPTKKYEYVEPPTLSRDEVNNFEKDQEEEDEDDPLELLEKDEPKTKPKLSSKNQSSNISSSSLKSSYKSASKIAQEKRKSSPSTSVTV